MKFLAFVITIFFFGSSLYAQKLDVEGAAQFQRLNVGGKVKIGQMNKVNTADSIAVRLADGTLGVRDASTLIEYQILSISDDTIYLKNGGFVILPDADTKNEIQQLEVSKMGDTLYLSESNWVIIPGISAANPKPIDASAAAMAMEMTGFESAYWVLPDGSQPPDTSTFHLGYGILSSFGPSVLPQTGSDFAVISTGAARLPGDMDYTENLKKGYENSPPPGFPKVYYSCDGPPCTPSPNAFDGIALRVRFTTPSNATGLYFKYKFYTEEYPDWICSEFSDQVAVYINPPLDGIPSDNIVFDAIGNPINIISVEVCNPPILPCYTCVFGDSELNGTGFEGHGASNWLIATAPLDPNTTYEITFAIWDAGDEGFTSTLLLDNWQWITN